MEAEARHAKAAGLFIVRCSIVRVTRTLFACRAARDIPDAKLSSGGMMNCIAYVTLDVFTSERFSGNQLATIGVDYSDVPLFLDRLEELKSAGSLRKLTDVLADHQPLTQHQPSRFERIYRAFAKPIFIGATITVAIFAAVWQSEIMACW
ncbi:MAG TPA: hypothetical protein VL202_21485 [Pararhizobium sp.]|uniref:hypothetical protein n=1 Tax=Pararhizobium sp. TaxID=1977563 RepID=UPI002CE2370F|nr:hypothetical protein [Pararhizobium sp.]HTO33717.1 hypothetical protein [Pararhizobium sp.]